MLAQAPVVSGTVVVAAFFVIRGIYSSYTTWAKEHPESDTKMYEAVGWIIGGVVVIAVCVAIFALIYDTRDSGVWATIGIIGGIVGLIATVVGFNKKSAVTEAANNGPVVPTTLVFVGKTVTGRPGNEVLSGAWKVMKVDDNEIVLSGTADATYRMTPAMFTAALADGTLKSK